MVFRRANDDETADQSLRRRWKKNAFPASTFRNRGKKNHKEVLSLVFLLSIQFLAFFNASKSGNCGY